MDHASLLIVGGGLAGAAAVESYRKAGGAESVAIISADADLPVHRPPLSKEYLRGDEVREKVLVHPAEFYRDNAIAVHLDTRVDRIEPDEKRVVLADGRLFGFDTLVLATGARPRRLDIPGAGLPGVYYLRSLVSADRLREAYNGARRAVIIGAGFIGMEVAASLNARGMACTVVEMGPRMWPRIVPPVTAGFIQRYFESRGVSLRFGASVKGLEGERRVRSVVLESGETLEADLVVAGVGVALNTGLAEQAGLEVDRTGIIVDEYLHTSHPAVYATGDVASFPDPIGGRLHLEHWDNALQQGRALGQTLAGSPTPFDHVAYFFSDLFDLSLNMIGYPLDWDDIVVRGEPESGQFTTVYLRNGAVSAALMINDDQHFDTWTALVKARRGPNGEAASLADPAIDPVAILHSAAGSGGSSPVRSVTPGRM